MSPFVYAVFLVTAVGVMTCAEAEEPFALPIIGGVASPVSDFPFLVSLSSDGGSRWDNVCGGSIINESFILTAAHCEEPIENIRVVAGLYDLKEKNAGQSVAVSAFISHPRYDCKTQNYDIALVRLSSPLTLKTREVEKATLNTDNSCPAVTASCTVTGWGLTAPEPTGTPSDVRKKVNLRVFSQKECEDYYYKGTISDGMLCAGNRGPDAEAAFCSGDSGGPLIANCGGRTTVVGVVSCNQDNCSYSPGEAGIFTRVSFFKKWITTGDLSEVIPGNTGSGGTSGRGCCAMKSKSANGASGLNCGLGPLLILALLVHKMF